MAFQSCPQIASIAIHATNNGKQIANILHAHKSVPYTQTHIDDLASGVEAAVSGVYEPLMSDNLLLADLTVTGLENINDFQSTITFGASPGTASGNPLPANNSLVATLRSGLTGRSARGRIYTFPTGASNVSSTGGDLYTSGYVTNVAALWSAVFAAIATSGWDQVILSRFTGGAERLTGVGFLVTDVEVRNSVADSQRRRLPKGH